MAHKKNYKCLMVELRDHRKFFTHEKNLDHLIEFSKTFDAELSVVRVKEADVLDLIKLAPAICNPNCSVKKPDVEILEIKLTRQKKRSRSKILKNANIIKEYVKNRFLDGESVKLNDVAKCYRKFKLTAACFCNHIKSVRKELSKQGYIFEQTAPGEYRISCRKDT